MRTMVFGTALALAAAGAAVPLGAARADIPSLGPPTLPSRVLLVGTSGGVADPLGSFQVVVRFFDGTPVVNSVVVASFTSSPGYAMCSTQPNPFVSCGGASGSAVGALTDATGTATLTILGRADHGEPDAGEASLALHADGIYLGTVRVAALDHDGGGMSPADLSLWQDDFFTSEYRQRSDLNGDGALGPADLSFMLTAFFASGSTENCVAACP